MRTFIAIELSEEFKDLLSQIQEKLKLSGADVKWVAPDNIHLTLKFLGEIDDKKLDRVIQAMQEATAGKGEFSLRLSSLGAFPKIDYPRVIWAGIDKGDKETKEIVKILEEKIAKIGIPKEDRPFSSHITIGRVKSNLHKDALIKSLNQLSDAFIKETKESPVSKITLFKSTLTPKGPVYEPLKEIKMGSDLFFTYFS